MLSESSGSVVCGCYFVKEVLGHGIPISTGNYFIFSPEIIQDIRRVGAGGIQVRIAALMLCGDIFYMAGDLYQFIPPVVGLSDDAFISFSNMVFETDDIFKIEIER